MTTGSQYYARKNILIGINNILNPGVKELKRKLSYDCYRCALRKQILKRMCNFQTSGGKQPYPIAFPCKESGYRNIEIRTVDIESAQNLQIT